jgi:hypothetical protein
MSPVTDLFNSVLGSSGGTKDTSTQVNYLPQQISDIDKTLAYKQNTVNPAFNNALQQIQGTYNQNLPGVYNQAQNQVGNANQVQATLGQTGESALRTGVSGLENLFSPQYEQNQVRSALAPAQAMYNQNLANQQAAFGGAGNLGSARQALAGNQLAGQTQAAQMQTAANIQQQIEGQRLQAANQLAGIGQGNLNGTMNAAQQGVAGSMIPQQYAGQYAQQTYAMPTGMYQPQYPGQNSSSSSQQSGMGLGGLVGKIGSALL